jgi:hypothetical protein
MGPVQDSDFTQFQVIGLLQRKSAAGLYLPLAAGRFRLNAPDGGQWSELDLRVPGHT